MNQSNQSILRVVMVTTLLVLSLLGCGADMDDYDDDGDDTGWSVSGNLVVNRPKKFLKLQTKFPRPENYTLQFNIDPPVNPGLSARAAARADIVWTVKGNAVQRSISVSDGSAITGTAEAVDVRMYDDTTSGFFLTNPEYKASIQVSRGTRGSNKQPPYLVLDPKVLLPGNTTTVAIPADVGATSVFVVAGMVNTVAAAAPHGSILAVQQGGIGVVTVWDPREHDWVPLDPGAFQLIYSVNAAVPASVRFTTYLGIEG